jgi:hypothetical protein
MNDYDIMTPEEILQEDMEFFISSELESIEYPKVWGRYILGENVRVYSTE